MQAVVDVLQYQHFNNTRFSFEAQVKRGIAIAANGSYEAVVGALPYTARVSLLERMSIEISSSLQTARTTQLLIYHGTRTLQQHAFLFRSLLRMVRTKQSSVYITEPALQQI